MDKELIIGATISYCCSMLDNGLDPRKELIPKMAEEILNALATEDEVASGYGFAPEPNLVVVEENVKQVPLVVGAGSGGQAITKDNVADMSIIPDNGELEFVMIGCDGTPLFRKKQKPITEDEGCPLCQKPEVLVHWQNVLKDYERFMVETEKEIILRKIDKYIDHIKSEADPVIARELIGIFEACKDWIQREKE